MSGCGSSKKQLEKGNYDAAIEKSVKQLRKDRTDKKQIDPFEKILETKKHELGITLDTEFEVEDLQDIVAKYKAAMEADFFKKPLLLL